MIPGGVHNVFYMDAVTAPMTTKVTAAASSVTLSFQTMAAGAAVAEKQIQKTVIATSLLAGAWQGITVALMAVAGGLAAQAGAFGISVLAAQKFDTLMRQIAAVGGLNAQQTVELTNEINRLAKTYGTAGDEIALGTLELVKAGVAGSELRDVLEAITQAAMDPTIGFAQAAALYVSTTRAFAKEGLTATQVFDMMRAAANAAIIDVEEFTQTLQVAAATANLVGVSSGQLFALAASLTQVGIRSRIASTGLRQLFVNLIQNQEEVQAWIDSFGVSVEIVKDGSLNILEFIDAMQGVDVTLEDVSAAFDFLDVRAANALFGIINAGPEVGRILDAVGQSAGATADFANQMAESIALAWGRLRETFLGIFRQTEFTERLAFGMNLLADTLVEMVPAFQELITTLVEGFITNMPTLLQLVQNMVELVVQLSPVISTLAGGMAFLLGILKETGIELPLFILAVAVLTKGLIGLTGATLLMNLAAAGTKAMFFGMLLLFSDAPQSIRLLGAALLGLAAAFWAVAIAKAAAKGPLGLVDVATWAVIAAAAVGFAAAAVVVATPEGFEKGSEYIPEDTVAILHRGERVMTVEENVEYTKIKRDIEPVSDLRERLSVPSFAISSPDVVRNGTVFIPREIVVMQGSEVRNEDTRKFIDRLVSGTSINNASTENISTEMLTQVFQNGGNRFLSFHNGSVFVPQDTVAMLHRGERVLTSEENRFFTGGIHGGSFTINVYDANAKDVDEILMRYNR